jgi:hypothetical protein
MNAPTSLQAICPGACKHLVDTDYIVRMKTHAEMEVILPNRIDHMLVGGNASSFKGLRGNLLFIQGKQMNARWENIAADFLFSDIVNLDLRVCHKQTSSSHVSPLLYFLPELV